MGFDLDELRRDAMDDNESNEGYDTLLDSVEQVGSDRMFGMTAAERMFVSIGCFLMTSLGGFLLLLLTDKIAI